jgi:hypothetical protein
VRAGALAAVAAVAVALVGAGCGDDGVTTTPAPEGGELTAAERKLVEESEAAIVDYCAQRALGLTDPDKRPTAGQQAQALEAVDALIDLTARKPDAKVTPSSEMALFVGDLTENLEGSNCDPLIVGRLQEGLASLPAF